jgi:hypothetical protein
MQRGFVSTLAASAKRARERSLESEIEAKSEGDRKLLLVAGVCAELVTEPMSAAHQSKLESDIGRINAGSLGRHYNLSRVQKFIPKSARLAEARA